MEINGRTIIEQSKAAGEFSCGCQKAGGEGGKVDWHAKKIEDEENVQFKRKLRAAARIWDTFLFRKVGSEVSRHFLNEHLQLGV